jgi:hypothetical protein
MKMSAADYSDRSVASAGEAIFRPRARWAPLSFCIAVGLFCIGAGVTRALSGQAGPLDVLVSTAFACGALLFGICIYQYHVVLGTTTLTAGVFWPKTIRLADISDLKITAGRGQRLWVYQNTGPPLTILTGLTDFSRLVDLIQERSPALASGPRLDAEAELRRQAKLNAKAVLLFFLVIVAILCFLGWLQSR